MDRVSLRTMASGSGRPVRGPFPRDITSQTRTPATPGADGTGGDARTFERRCASGAFEVDAADCLDSSHLNPREPLAWELGGNGPGNFLRKWESDWPSEGPALGRAGQFWTPGLAFAASCASVRLSEAGTILTPLCSASFPNITAGYTRVVSERMVPSASCSKMSSTGQDSA